jgi:hypothetical protein
VQQGQQGHVQEAMHVAVAQPMRALTCAEAPPSIEEQMALADGLTSRIPQRCVPRTGHSVRVGVHMPFVFACHVVYCTQSYICWVCLAFNVVFSL